MISKKGQYREEKRVIAGGSGEIVLHHRFEREQMHGRSRLCAELLIAPGHSIGEHPHADDMEIFYMLEGELVSVNPDGSEEKFLPGDVMMTGGGERHSLRNDADVPARMLAVISIP